MIALELVLGKVEDPLEGVTVKWYSNKAPNGPEMEVPDGIE
jgi:hypothetical protein